MPQSGCRWRCCLNKWPQHIHCTRTSMSTIACNRQFMHDRQIATSTTDEYRSPWSGVSSCNEGIGEGDARHRVAGFFAPSSKESQSSLYADGCAARVEAQG